MKPSKRPTGVRRPGHGSKRPWRRPQRRPTAFNGLDNAGQDGSTLEDEEEEYFDDFAEEEVDKDFQEFGVGETLGVDFEENDEELQHLYPLSQDEHGPDISVVMKLISQTHTFAEDPLLHDRFEYLVLKPKHKIWGFLN